MIKTPLTELAERLARKHHRGQTRRDGITPYIIHLEQVVELLPKYDRLNEEIVASAWLHDVVEKGGLTIEELTLDYMIPLPVFLAVSALTKKKWEPYADYLERVKGVAIAVVVKRADIAANLADAPTPHQRRKYALALEVLEDPKGSGRNSSTALRN